MKQIKSLVELLAYAKEVGPKKISVALAEDPEVLEAVENARKEGIAEAFLVGNADKLKEVADSMGVDLSNYEVVDVKGSQNEVSIEAVKLVSSGKADILMKGMISTANFLRGVLNKEVGLRTGGTLSHVYIHQVEGYDRLFFVCDPAFNMYPDLPTKVNIINNTVQLAHAFGIEMPKVAVLAAVEVVNPDMPCTLDAAALSQMNRRKQIKGCIVDGPFALDNAISEESAKHKGIVSEVAGKADILLVPDIEAGNMMAKAIVYFSNNKTAGLVLGAKAPVVLTSRSDTPETKLLSIASAVALSVYQNK
ncbi:phosphate butyryltransferase [Thermovirga lienii DSM 17291]|jgi:phosphate butyryltransferase|uniref:Phosphate butyryltransferase n=1 Tax=Thermovirga lienii (strain ATCC BAA-1197 / DSM 17291 / Cas60314) TaxID=580340 RepID=G7V893_THELD|nr:phosphate butyryltransferase [Thermovirga lienii]AER67424.1 phosphate butyryltransferase [Thermovirga lienii DSM 17291]MDN5319468.1 phosphate butyryltransferase [Thermovirga sp.]MDN5368321.1 phosphate butyryltransferase [Thermovirga sp.]